VGRKTKGAGPASKIVPIEDFLINRKFFKVDVK